uniref:SCAN box domain-containing protein n=1 Tax=Crocodylus porosus TaxID=8502 RepID=A0A7M4ES20_CROPO
YSGESTQAAYRAMSRSDAMGYEKVKEEILHRLDITPERHRQAFRERKAAEVRTPQILWQTLADLLGKWLRPEIASKEQIIDQVLMEQLINDLEEGTRNWVRCHCPTSSREALQWAEQFDATQGERRRTTIGLVDGRVDTALLGFQLSIVKINGFQPKSYQDLDALTDAQGDCSDMLDIQRIRADSINQICWSTETDALQQPSASCVSVSPCILVLKKWWRSVLK